METTAVKKKRVRTWSIQAIREKEFKEIDLGDDLNELIGKPTPNFCSIIYGKAKKGKSTFALTLAKKLSEHGKVLYVASEEMISKSLKARIIQLDITEAHNIRVIPVRGIDQIEHVIRMTHPKFIFIDSVQTCGFKLKDFMRLKNDVFRNRKSWHIVSQSSNAGKMMLPQGWVHETDVKIELVEGTALSEGRFNPQGRMTIIEKSNTLFNQK